MTIEEQENIGATKCSQLTTQQREEGFLFWPYLTTNEAALITAAGT